MSAWWICSPAGPGARPPGKNGGLETEPATELGVTCGSRTRGLQSHILAFSPPELTPPRTGASGSSRTNKAREERRVYRALSSPLPVPMRMTSDDGHSCSRPAVGCRRRCRRLVPSGSPRACGSCRSTDPGVRPARRGHEKTLPAAGSEGFGGHSPISRGATERPHPSSPWPDTAIPKRIAGRGRVRSRPRGSARCRPVQLVASVSTSQSSSVVRDAIWQRWRDSNPMGAVLETAALASELHLFRKPQQKAASDDPGRLADLGLVVSLFKTSTSAPRRP